MTDNRPINHTWTQLWATLLPAETRDMPHTYVQDLYPTYWTVPGIQLALLNHFRHNPHVYWTELTETQIQTIYYWSHIAYEANGHSYDNFNPHYDASRMDTKNLKTVIWALSAWLLHPNVTAAGSTQEQDITTIAQQFLQTITT